MDARRNRSWIPRVVGLVSGLQVVCPFVHDPRSFDAWKQECDGHRISHERLLFRNTSHGGLGRTASLVARLHWKRSEVKLQLLKHAENDMLNLLIHKLIPIVQQCLWWPRSQRKVQANAHLGLQTKRSYQQKPWTGVVMLPYMILYHMNPYDIWYLIFDI